MRNPILATLLLLIVLTSCVNKKSELADISQQDAESIELFKLIPPDSSGVKFVNQVPDNERINILTYEYFYNGGGVAVGDINNDGLPDLYFTGNLYPNKLYLNKGDMTFEDITASSGTAGGNGWSTGVSMADVNGDGFLDIYVCRSGKFGPENRKNELFINQGDLTFREEGEQYGLADPAYSTQALFFDMDNDNDLDMFLLNHSVRLFLGEDALQLKKIHDDFAGDKLYRNDNGKFRNVTKLAGIHTNPLGYGLGVAAGDINGDGFMDLYVTNDYVEPDYLYYNNGDGTFSDRIKEVTKHISNFGMGVDIADVNNDGLQDIFVADMVAEDNYRQKTNMRAMNPEEFYQAVDNGFHYQYMFNSLQLNNGNNSFSEIAQLAGISNTDWSWSTLLIDLDNDSFRDLVVTNGFRKEFSNKDFANFRKEITKKALERGDEASKRSAMVNLLEVLPENKISNYVFRNQGDLTFSNQTEAWGFDDPFYSNGAAYADLDNDGDLDLVVSNIDEEAVIYRNMVREKEASGNYLKIIPKGPEGNPFGIGLRVELHLHGNNTIVQDHIPVRGYQSSHDHVMHIGVGKAHRIDSLIAKWPDGKVQLLQRVKTNRTLELRYDKAVESFDTEGKTPQPMFVDFTEQADILFRHVENSFHDFDREILLPHKMSRFGPALAVADVNGDGLEDFFVGGALGQSGALFLQQINLKFIRMSGPWEADKRQEDVGAEFFDADGDGDLDLYVVSGGTAFASNSTLMQDRLYLNNGQEFSESKALPAMITSGSVAKAHDFDGDGDQDLFVGGRVIPGQYPFPPRSYVLENRNGEFVDVTEDIAPEVYEAGMVTDALWSDMDQDGSMELIIVGEWMPIMVMKYTEGRFSSVSEELNLDTQTGWWNSISEYDLNQDGKTDYLAGNLGLNYKYKTSPEEPFQVYCSDFDQNGSKDIVLGYFNDGELYPLRGRQCSSEQMPFISEKFQTYHEFGQASLNEIYGEALDQALNYQASTFASSILLNTGAGFEVQKLPNRAQISNINASIIHDFDGDGIPEIIVAGNMHPVEIETIRNDASIGLLMKPSGTGGLKPVSALHSGIDLPGDVKDMKLIRLGSQLGFLVANNNSELQLILFNGVSEESERQIAEMMD